MAFRKSYGTRKMTQPRRTTTYRKKYTPKRTTVPRLQREVTRIKKQIRPLTKNDMFYQYPGTAAIGNALGNSVYVIPLTKCSNWVRVFATDADDESAHFFRMDKLGFKAQIDAAGERAVCSMTAAVLSLTDIGESELFNVSTGSLNALVQGTHYVTNAFNGLGVYFNKKYFKIHYYRNITTGSPNGLAISNSDLVKSITYTHKLPVEFNNPGGDWRAKGFVPKTTKNLFFVIINNDLTFDSSVTLRWNTLIHGTAV